jgi:hypothetical protein
MTLETSRCAAAAAASAANDNEQISAWPERTFRFAEWQMVA